MIRNNKYLIGKGILLQTWANIFGKVRYKDKFGLRYYLWKDTRIKSTVFNGVRTDDTGVLFVIFRILDRLMLKKKKIICLDVGAYIGVISLAMSSRMKNEGEIFSFEPSKVNYGRLVENVKLNGFSNIFCQHVGVSDYVEDSVLLQVMDDPGGTFIIKDNDAMSDYYSDEAIHEKIGTTTIDKFCKEKEINCVDVLKIDSEGYDHKVLAGAKRLLKSGSIYYIICEYSQNKKRSEERISILESYSYDVFFIVRNQDFLIRSIEKYPFDYHKGPLNILAISPNAPHFLKGKGLDIR